MTSETGYWFFTAPYEQVLIRRGDPLGFRAMADQFADLLVPGLSNRTYDARWISILCWALQNANSCWRQHDEPDGSMLPGASREAARELYAWIRPLELLWVARTLQLCEDDAKGRQLPGQRAVKWWLREPDRPRFGLTEDQYTRYRQTGPYGGYRVALRRLPGLTMGGDGWRPDSVGRDLAGIVGDSIRWRPVCHKGKRRRVQRYDDFWLSQWDGWDRSRTNGVFPDTHERIRQLPGQEAKLLRSVLFAGPSPEADAAVAAGNRRLEVAKLLHASGARTHAELCGYMARHLKGCPEIVRNQLRLLEPFTRIADAGVDVMSAFWRSIEGRPFITLHELAGSDEDKQQLNRLNDEVSRCAGMKFLAEAQGVQVFHRFCRAVADTKGNERALAGAVLDHHLYHGGGMKWFKRIGDKVVRNAPANAAARVAHYRFRLWALARIAVQCSILKAMPRSLQSESRSEIDEGGEA